MNKKPATLETRVEELEQASAAHERRLAALETRLDPVQRERRMTQELDLLLGELAGLGRKDMAEGKEVE